ncbi:ATP synthase mitochondrial F1 complex assembly factor 1 [Araneus ventricosus]|uniref:ATP synthase mitochondrial F1 complex assembly factor 1 n=1 Tax=Araneus ventricosus TaxID=182803 RepID=A0A4Y2ADN5_ARAVE|nr:ATP synthase mitochondrial F1 complex assembly factor 1 [Araneus ventricosus]
MRWLSSLRSWFITPQPKQYNILRAFSRTVDTRQDITENPYFEKYAEKIAKVQKKPADDIKARLEKNLNSIQSHPYYKDKQTSEFKESNSNRDAKFSQLQRQNDLNKIMKLDAIEGKTAEEIESIWKQYHEVKQGVFAVLPAQAFEKMHANLKEYPVFVFPFPRSHGYEFIMCQFQDQNCYFTSLLNYQAYKENAPISLTVTYFTELQETKGIVLMRGEYDDSYLKAHEAQCLTNQLQLYYGGGDSEKLQLIEKFNKYPDSFKHMDLISNFEYGLGK